ncbi:HrpJ domain-containing protein [Aeromonas veronii]
MHNTISTGRVSNEPASQVQPNSTHEDDTTSVLTLAQAALSECQNDALEETQEDLSFALGGRINELRRGKDEETSGRGRVLMHKLVAEIAMVEPSELEHQLDDGAWQQAPKLLWALRSIHAEPGTAALQLALWLAHGKSDSKLRSRMEHALSTLMEEEDIALSLFGVLEFGVITPGLRQELVSLYQRASAPNQKLSQWLKQFGERRDRQRKIRTLLRLISYELSAGGQSIVGHHLAAVMGDLRQLLRLLGLEAHCDQTAQALAIPTVSGEVLLGLVVQLVELIWVNCDMLEDMLPNISSFDNYRLLQALLKLLQLLPEDCFSDSEQKNQLVDAITILRDNFV